MPMANKKTTPLRQQRRSDSAGDGITPPTKTSIYIVPSSALTIQ